MVLRELVKPPCYDKFPDWLNPTKGGLTVKAETWFNSYDKINLKPQARKIGMVFQDYALFPHLNVRQNLEFALDKGQVWDSVDELISTFELNPIADQKPDALSGGQQQRVALARALVRPA